MNNKMIKKALIEQFTCEINSLRKCGEGNDCIAYLANNEIVFKFPKHKNADENIKREVLTLDFLKDKLPLQIPQVKYFAKSDAFDCSLIGITKVSGNALTSKSFKRLQDAHKDIYAKQLADFLKTLHSLETNNLQTIIVNKKETYEQDFDDVAKFYANDLTSVQKANLTSLKNYIFSNEVLYKHNYCLTHGDISCDHIFYDNRTNTLCAIIDFADSTITDPDKDFMCLLEDSDEEYGQDFGIKVLEYYGHKNINNVLQKFNLNQKYWAIEQLLFGHLYADKKMIKNGLKDLSNLQL